MIQRSTPLRRNCDDLRRERVGWRFAQHLGEPVDQSVGALGPVDVQHGPRLLRFNLRLTLSRLTLTTRTDGRRADTVEVDRVNPPSARTGSSTRRETATAAYKRGIGSGVVGGHCQA